jgi:hypothetical protein
MTNSRMDVWRIMVVAGVTMASVLCLDAQGVAMTSEKSGSRESPSQQPQSQLPPPRPGHFAELEELQAARKAANRAAYDLFLARHPGSRYSPEARRERDALAR